MARKRKLRLIVDANLIDPSFLESISSLKNVRVKTIAAEGVSDSDIFAKANKDDYHILTDDFKDFLRIFKKDQTLRVGIIGINTKVSLRKIAPKVLRLLRILGHQDVYHRYYEVSNTGCRVHHRRDTKSEFINWRSIENVLSN